jgi:predicted enzyme related to lactoylglutathione lyase
MKRLLTGISLAILLFAPAVACAQILVAGEGPVVYGHHHLNTTNMDAQKKFYVDTLGGSVAKIGSGDRQQEIIKFPNVLIFFRPMQAPTGGSIGTTVNHIGFSVPDLKPLVAKIKANGFKIITAVRRDDGSGQSGVRVRGGPASRCVPELLAVTDADRRHDRPLDRPYRLRDQKPRGVHEEARSPGHQTGSSLH